MPRTQKILADLRLPHCPTPRPDDAVLWYSDARPVRGKFIGHAPEGKPIVTTEFNNIYMLPSFDYLRILDPYNCKGANWEDLETNALVQSPTNPELNEFNRILSQRIPPGPQYIELITEIWNRGYEIFLVGGTVRDVIAGTHTNDVDLVTSMPLTRAMALLESMYRRKPSVSIENGFVRLGGVPGSGDPFIDLRMFTHHEPGTPNARFGSRFDLDLRHRDFACNAVYYDPINEALIDPSGIGIKDAEQKNLCIVCDIARRAPFHLAQIFIRFYKFVNRGFTAPDNTVQRIHAEFRAAFPAMHKSLRIRYIKTQILSKLPKVEHEEALNGFRDRMIEYGDKNAWDQYIEPIKAEILE